MRPRCQLVYQQLASHRYKKLDAQRAYIPECVRNAAGDLDRTLKQRYGHDRRGKRDVEDMPHMFVLDNPVMGKTARGVAGANHRDFLFKRDKRLEDTLLPL